MVPPIMPDLGKRFQAGQNTWSNSKCFTSMLNLCTLLPRFLGQKKKNQYLKFCWACGIFGNIHRAKFTSYCDWLKVWNEDPEKIPGFGSVWMSKGGVGLEWWEWDESFLGTLIMWGPMRHPSGTIKEAAGYVGLEPRKVIVAENEDLGVANLESEVKQWSNDITQRQCMVWEQKST